MIPGPTVELSPRRAVVRCLQALVFAGACLPVFAEPVPDNSAAVWSASLERVELVGELPSPAIIFWKKSNKGGGGSSSQSGNGNGKDDKDKNDDKDDKDKNDDKDKKDRKDKKDDKDKKDQKDKNDDKDQKDKKDDKDQKDKKDDKDKNDKNDKEDKEDKDDDRDDGGAHDHETEENRHEHDNERHDHDNNESHDHGDSESHDHGDSDDDAGESHDADSGDADRDDQSVGSEGSDADRDGQTDGNDGEAEEVGGDSPSEDSGETSTTSTEAEEEPTIVSSETVEATPHLMLSGTPPESVTAGHLYLFTPGLEASGESAPVFMIDGLPHWAGFDGLTGELFGTPDEADVGFYEAITISATDGVVGTSLPTFSIEVVAPGAAQGAVTLSWAPPTENEDGSYLVDLAGYWIYWGNNPGTYTEWMRIDNPGLTTIVIEDLVPGTWEFAMTSFNAKGVESRLSSAVTRTVGVDPIEPASQPKNTSQEPLLCGEFTSPGYKNGEDLPDVSGTEGLTFGPGRHVITEQILLSSGDVLSGAGSDQTTLYFPDGLIAMGHICPNIKDCWSWENGLIVASGTNIGIQNVTIEFPAHSFTHYKQELGAQPGYNGVAFETCENCWAKDVHVINSDVGFIARWSNNVTIEDTSVTANNDGSHIHYAISTYSRDILVNVFSTYNDSHHGLTAQWGVERGVFSNGTLIGPTDIEPEHNGPVSTTLYSNIHGDVRRVQKFNRDDEPVSASFVDVNGETFGVSCAP